MGLYQVHFFLHLHVQMSIPDGVFSFAQYWKKVLKSSTEAREILTWLIALLAGVVGWVEQWAHAPAFLPWLSYLISAVLILWGIFWPPFKVHEEQRRAYEAARTKLMAEHACETIGFYRELEEVASSVKTKRKEVKNLLADYLLQIEARIKEINALASVAYIESLEDPEYHAICAPDELARRVRTMLDKKSLELIARIAECLAENIGEDQAKLFKSISGIALTPPDHTGELRAVYANRQRLYVDYLNHWAKNLIEVIKGLE
jgi:hypothetical protein